MRLFSSHFAAILLLALLGVTLSAQQPAQLTITTNSPLPPGTVGSEYLQTLQASGGTPPLTWSVAAGSLPNGLALNSQTGAISGVPSRVGSFSVQIRVTDSSAQDATKNFSITIDPQGLIIQNDAVLPRGKVGVEFLVQFNAVGGTGPYRNWQITDGQLPGGIALLPITGQLSGAPTRFGTFRFTITVDDSAFETASKRFTLFVDPATLTITTQSPLPLATVGTHYQQTLEASGGPVPIRWESTSELPAGLNLSEAGSVSGTPTIVGAFQILVQATDATGASATRTLSLAVADPTAMVTLEGEQGPSEQATVLLTMATAHPFELAGQVELSFQPDAINNSEDEAIRFRNGLRTAQFTVPANATGARFAGGKLQLAIGTTAGVITISVTALQAGNQAITPSADAKLELTIAQSPPVIEEATVASRTEDVGVTLQIKGFSTPREVTRALFRFTPVSGRTLQNSQVTVDLTESANAWYQSAASAASGSAFVYTQPFTIQGGVSAVQSVVITLTNSLGDSQQATITF